MSDDALAGLVDERARKAVKNILTLEERIAAPLLDRRDQERIRAIVKDEVGELARLATTLLRSLESQLRDGYTLNQLWLEQIAEGVGVEPPAVA